ncbi:MAG: MATE family efflux transporter [Clostridia bacterium]|nr:MATE family efflux transporter [Clostridia bacterium]
MKEKSPIQLSDSFGYGRLIRFVIPSVVMMIFTSIYSIVDGFFVSNFVNKTAFAAVNLMMPLIMVLGAVGFMIGTGGTAIVAKTLGLGEKENANRYFSFLTYFTVISGVVLAALGIFFARPVASLLGADEGVMLENCVTYCQLVLLGLPFFMLQNVFQSFFITAEKPKLGLFVTVMAGVTNIVLDALLIAVFEWGIAGAAIATAISQFVGGVFPLIYFVRDNSSTLRLGKSGFYGKVLLHTVTNGSSELMSNISSSVVTIFYNMQLMRFAGENGVAAYGAIMYVSFIFAAMFIGFSIGSSPIVSFHYGAGNRAELRSLRKKSVVIIGITSFAMTALSLLLSAPLSELFVGYDRELFELTHRGFIIFSFVFLTMGMNIFGSGFFTALNNGIVSAVIAFLRTLVFQIASVLILPIFFEIDGVWFSIILADVLAFIVTLVFLVANRKKYGY